MISVPSLLPSTLFDKFNYNSSWFIERGKCNGDISQGAHLRKYSNNYCVTFLKAPAQLGPWESTSRMCKREQQIFPLYVIGKLSSKGRTAPMHCHQFIRTATLDNTTL